MVGNRAEKEKVKENKAGSSNPLTPAESEEVVVHQSPRSTQVFKYLYILLSYYMYLSVSLTMSIYLCKLQLSVHVYNYQITHLFVHLAIYFFIFTYISNLFIYLQDKAITIVLFLQGTVTDNEAPTWKKTAHCSAQTAYLNIDRLLNPLGAVIPACQT